MQIQYDIPIPPRRSVSLNPLAKQIEVGGSVRFDTLSKAKAFSNSVRALKKGTVMRQVREDENGRPSENGKIYFRVWRDS